MSQRLLMKNALIISLSIALLAMPALGVETSTKWNGTASIKFAGTSTLHSWSGTVAADPFVATIKMDGPDKPKQLTAKVTVKAAKMDTAEPDRDKNMRVSMKVADHPLITGTMDAPFSKILNTKSGLPASLPFTLELVGKRHDIEATISNWALKDKTATFDMDFELSLKKCGIDTPTVLLFVRVGDTIKLHSSVKLVRVAD